nr:uncharacterized protein LOC102147471 [Equus caballus]
MQSRNAQYPLQTAGHPGLQPHGNQEALVYSLEHVTAFGETRAPITSFVTLVTHRYQGSSGLCDGASRMTHCSFKHYFSDSQTHTETRRSLCSHRWHLWPHLGAGRKEVPSSQQVTLMDDRGVASTLPSWVLRVVLPGHLLACYPEPACAVLLAFLWGCMQLAMGSLCLGFLLYFVSCAIIKGFTSAATITVDFGQIQFDPEGICHFWNPLQRRGGESLQCL